MTDEEMAEEYANKNVPADTFGYRSLDDVHYDVKQAFLAGLKAGRPEWHKVADGDLPKGEAEYLVIFESDGTRYTGLESYYPDTKEWSTICNIIVWYEIPKYTEK